MDVKLVVEQPRLRKRTFHLRTDEGVIGRAHGCVIRIGSAEVSRRHCRLRVRDGYLTVEDLGSRNGTQLNGEEVVGQQVVRPGDRLRVGPVTFIAEYQLTPEAIDRLLRGEDASAGEEDVAVLEEALPDFDGEGEGLLPLGPLAEEEEVLELDEVTEAGEGEVLAVAEDVGEPAGVVDELELVDADQLQLPETEELRDILTGLDEEDEPPKKRKKKG
jgi:pSer/pThr/pTyr-binding forkhead associated (FHA) protein